MQQFINKLWAIAGNSRTILVAYLVEVIAVLDEAKMIDFSSLFGAERAGRILAVMGLVIFGLRLITTGPAKFRVKGS